MDPTQNGAKLEGIHAVSSISNSENTKVGAVNAGERLASQSFPKPKPRKIKPTKADKEGVANALEQHAQIVHARIKPLPNQIGSGTFDEAPRWGKLRNDLKALRSGDVKTLKEFLLAKVKGEKIVDDKTMIMERVIKLVSNLPTDSKLRVELTNSFLTELWDTLEHPPSLYVGDQYRYRRADGSYNNIMYPQLGAAGSSYARSVNVSVLRPGAMPDPGLIYDSVMKRTEYKKNPNNVSSILWYWAAIVIHDLFWTDHRDMSRNKTSSYLDLSPLYGSDQEMQNTIRTFKDGKLKADAFADKRLLGLPPGVGVLLIMFNRFHNYICDNLAAINEDGKFTPPSPSLPADKAEAAWKKYDEDLFQTARLVTCGMYMNIMLVDYVRNIVNLNRVDTTWTLDPRSTMGVMTDTKKGAESGTGNAVSAEFNLCYRWHSCISERDDKWIEEFYQEIFGKPASEVTVPDMMAGFYRFESQIPADPAERPLENFKRGPDGKFSDDDLVECIVSSIEDCAGSFGGRNVPTSMRAVEILGIIQARKWNLSGLNEFRKHFGLKPYATFEDINSDPEIADSLRRLYGHPDFVELYPGIVAEEHKKPMVPGVGITPTYTISRVVLSDAVCLVRGDRHYTIDYTPRNLTNWGYNDVQYDMNLNHGCVFYKLFSRAFPDHFKYNSVYSHFPMVIPSETEKILKDLKRDHLFDFSRPSRQSQPVQVSTASGASHVLSPTNSPKFNRTWHAAVNLLLVGAPKKSGTPVSSSAKIHDAHRNEIAPAILTPDALAHIKAFYTDATDDLLASESYHLAGQRMVDVVRDVTNLAPVRFVARLFELPLHTKENKKGIYTEHELYAVLSTLASVLFTETDPVRKFQLVEAAKTLGRQFAEAVERSGAIKNSKGKRKDPISAIGAALVNDLKKAGLDVHDIVWGHILPLCAAVVAYHGKLLADVVDFYLQPAQAAYLAAIQAMASQQPSEASDALLVGYALEAAQRSGSTEAHFSAAEAKTIPVADGESVAVHKGQLVTVVLPPTKDQVIEATRHSTSATTNSLLSALPCSALLGPISGTSVTSAALAGMMRAVFRRKGLRRVPGPQGELKKVQTPTGAFEYLREDWGAKVKWPVTMKVSWSG
ncbi:hypothetical protein VTJ83DRAFT_6120 [Remersonia thermophila]|uniref:Linoleate diol synthase n=1 Tax=Remersonia thermophila TaxID=72144 RepID=A0ABR4D8S4_9PEZI